MKYTSIALLTAALASCGDGSPDGHGHTHGPGDHQHDSPATADAEPAAEDDHAHEEVSLGSVEIDGTQVELAQGHGPLAAGEEAHLVVKLAYSDAGETVVRAWLGSEDRTLSYVGKGTYAAPHDEYDIHATAPDPLAEDARWWIEIVKPDGSKSLGSIEPLVD